MKDTLKSCTMHGHAHWLLTRFPDAEFVDVEGLVKLVSQDEANDWSLTPADMLALHQKLRMRTSILRRR